MLLPIRGYEVLIALSFLIILFYRMVLYHYFQDSKNHHQVNFKVFGSSQGLQFKILRFPQVLMFSELILLICVSKNNTCFPILPFFQFNSIKQTSSKVLLKLFMLVSCK